MLFNSFAFAGFFAGVLLLYHGFARWHRAQNAILLAASYLFYGLFDWRFLGLLVFSTGLDYAVSHGIFRAADARRRRALLFLSVGTNLTILGLFKYFDFFASSLVSLLASLGLHADTVTLGLALPVGISFYTFKTISYTVDVYRGKLEPAPSLLDYALCLSFFPQLLAGPIDRAVSLLPQVLLPRWVTAAQVDSGLFLLLWGLFKKVVVADNVAQVANAVFNDPAGHAGIGIAIGAAAYTLQIYGDFSGYSDMSRGAARLLGFETAVNFKLPFLAANPRDFWLRWHVSLSSWLRDYLYIPLGGNRGSKFRTQMNLFVTMLLGGLWHGAAWNFVLWGAYHGLLLMVHRSWERPGRGEGWPGLVRGLYRIGAVVVTLALTSYGWILFRADSAGQILAMTSAFGWGSTAATPDLAYRLGYFAAPVALMHLAQARSGDLLVAIRTPWWARGPLYAALLLSMCVFGVRESMEFIYFQF
ncbi:MAG: MBOAT family O-acyltransferase [Candidatus Geothermincolia bacterium]